VFFNNFDMLILKVKKIKKNIILIYFKQKIFFKNNTYCNIKHTLSHMQFCLIPS